MTLETPVWQAFDPATDRVPDSILALLDGEGPPRVVALAVAPTAEDGRWAARVSVRVAEAAAHRGARTLLVDLGLEGSTLDAELGFVSAEGITDVFQFGASVRRVSRGVREGTFLFVPAGTVVGDSSTILEHSRWEAVLAGYRKSGTLVLLHVPLSLEGASALLARADAVVLLAGFAEPADALVGASPGVQAVIGPPGAAEATAAGLGESSVEGGLVEEGSDPSDLPPGPEEDVASLEVLLAENIGVGEEPGTEPTWMDMAAGADEGGLVSATAEGTQESPPPAVEEGWTREGDPALEVPSGADLDPFWDDADASEPAAADGRAIDPDEFGAPALEDTALSAEFDGLPAVGSSSHGRSSRSRRRVFLILALIVIVVVALFALMRGDDGPTISESAPGGQDEAPIEMSAARSADPDMSTRPPESSVESEGSAEAPAVGTEPEGGSGSMTTVAAGGDPAGPEAADPPSAEGEAGGADARDRSSPNAVMRFGLTINAHESRAAAEDQARALQARVPSLQFVLAPVDVGGVTYYRVVAGPAETGEHAEQIRALLTGHVGSAVANGAIVRSTRLALLLGEYESFDDAMARRAEAERAGIPSYFAEYGPSTGPLRFRVYAGAYANAREANHLQTLMGESGLTGVILTERIGRPPQ